MCIRDRSICILQQGLRRNRRTRLLRRRLVGRLGRPLARFLDALLRFDVLLEQIAGAKPESYRFLDVYKRQASLTRRLPLKHAFTAKPSTTSSTPTNTTVTRMPST